MNAGRRLSSIVDVFYQTQRTLENANYGIDRLWTACYQMAELGDESGSEEVKSASENCAGVVNSLHHNIDYIESIAGVKAYEDVDNIAQRIKDIGDEFNAEWSDREIISALSTRIGSVLMIIFLVQIMAGIFRYSARMSAYYFSRHHILSIGEITREDLLELLGEVAVDFDKMPKNPISNLSDVAKQGVKAAIKKTD